MTRHFTASVWREGDWYVSQCREVDVASQGRTEEEAVVNLEDALALHFTPPVASGTQLQQRSDGWNSNECIRVTASTTC